MFCHFIYATKGYTLPQVISGSGVRYTDEREIVWWTHQSTVRVDVRDSAGKWKTEYSGLKEIQKRN
ncbi:MAG: MliC family protein [Deltaproteobacteria bacterium]|nr:MliC family protein [Deltaproteobacteria bacterium]